MLHPKLTLPLLKFSSFDRRSTQLVRWIATGGMVFCGLLAYQEATQAISLTLSSKVGSAYTYSLSILPAEKILGFTLSGLTGVFNATTTASGFAASPSPTSVTFFITTGTPASGQNFSSAFTVFSAAPSNPVTFNPFGVSSLSNQTPIVTGPSSTPTATTVVPFGFSPALGILLSGCLISLDGLRRKLTQKPEIKA